MAIYKNANLDISVAAEQNPNYNAKPSVQFSTQDKNTAKYTFTVKQNNKPVDLTGVTASVTLFSEDKSVFQSDANITNATEGKIEYVIPADAIRHHGKTRGDLRLTYPNGDVLGGLRFTFNIEQALIDRAAGTVGGVYIRDFETLKAEIQKTADSIKDIDVVRIDAKINELEQKVEEGGVGVDEQARQEIQEVTEQLAYTSREQSESRPLFKTAQQIPPKAYMTIIDDDARSAVWTKLKPISEEKNVPITLAVPVQYHKPEITGLTKEQLLYLQDTLGWEMASHSYTHANLRVLSENDLRREIIDSKHELQRWGLRVNHIVYPYGSGEGADNSPYIRELSSRYYDSGGRVGGGINVRPVRNFMLNRVAFGAFTEGANTLDKYKASVDQAIAQNGWIIFMTHCHEAEHNNTQQQHLRDIIDYAKANNVEIVNLNDGFKKMGNVVEIEGAYSVGHDGKVMGMGTEGSNVKMLGANGLTGAEPPNYFERNKVFYTALSTAFATSNGFPENKPGFLVTESIHQTGYEKQTYKIYDSNTVYTRTAKPNNTWGTWSKNVSTLKKTVTLDIGSIPANSVKSFDIPVSDLLTITGNETLVINPHHNTRIQAEVLINYFFAYNQARLIIRNMHTADLTVGSKEFLVTIIP